MTDSLNAQPEGFRLPASLGLDAETEATARQYAWSLVVQGVAEPDDFVDWAADTESLDEEVARRAYEFVVETRRAQQSSWGSVPRVPLTVAFEELDALGIVARQNFSCCGTCGSSEIHGERPEGRLSRGYVFFHVQDTESLIESNSTCLGYGAFIDAFISKGEWDALDETQRQSLYERTSVGLMVDTVLPVFERHGIKVVWDRTFSKRIELRDVEFYAPL